MSTGNAMNEKAALVVTSIAKPNAVLQELARGCREQKMPFIVIGDVPSPPDFELEGCDFYSLERQAATGFRLAALTPTRHYARKNLGYLLAARNGAELVVETDDDNIPYDTFWGVRNRTVDAAVVGDAGWTNVYRFFSDVNIWPRGLPLDAVQSAVPDYDTIPVGAVPCPIQQGLADDNPDVDAVYRLVCPLPQSFRRDRRVALTGGSWCPFNSQNTTWWREAFLLLYLPAYCSFRMTDIWRSFVAQRIAWANGWGILFHEPTVRQERNEHSLMRDFKDEVPGYLHNRAICEALDALSMPAGAEHIAANLRSSYEALVRLGVVDQQELALVDAWIADMSDCLAGDDRPSQSEEVEPR